VLSLDPIDEFGQPRLRLREGDRFHMVRSLTTFRQRPRELGA
jgi:hypothetical protein